MVFINSHKGLAMSKSLIRAAKTFSRLTVGDKKVTYAINKAAPIILLIAADDGTSGAHVAYATEHDIPVILLPSRGKVGELVGVCSVVCCVHPFAGHEEMIANLLLLG